MPTGTLYYTSTLTTLECGSCNIPFAIPTNRHDDVLATGAWFWCPNGHQIRYSQTTNAKLKAELEEAREKADGARDEARRQREHRRAAERRVTAMKGVVTRTKNRVAKGKCVRCSCTFPDLAEHMAEAHPDYAPDADE